MTSAEKTKIKVETTIQAPAEKVWELWTGPRHITQWNHASDDWHTPRAQNEVKEGGRFVYRMEAKDGSFGFDFGGTYDEVRPNEYMEYTLDDGRKVEVAFENTGAGTRVVETFEAEQTNSEDLQRQGWQAILNSFKRYAEQTSENP